MEEILLLATVLAPITLGVVEAVKKFTNVDKYLPLVAILIGVGLGASASFFGDIDMLLRIWAGGISGLMASGLFDTAKEALDKED